MSRQRGTSIRRIIIGGMLLIGMTIGLPFPGHAQSPTVLPAASATPTPTTTPTAILTCIALAPVDPPCYLPINISIEISIPPGATRWFVFDGKAGRVYRISAQAKATREAPSDSSPADPLIRVYRNDMTLLAEQDDLGPTTVDAEVVVQADRSDQYRVEIINLSRFGQSDHRVVVSVFALNPVDNNAARAANQLSEPSPAPPLVDPYEDNYAPDRATSIEASVPYTMTLRCPVVNGCVHGDHDFLKLYVKPDSTYIVATTDATPGVDPVLTLMARRNGTWVSVASNDDWIPGYPHALLEWSTSERDGEEVVIVVTSARRQDPNVEQPEYTILAGPSRNTEIRQAVESLRQRILSRSLSPTPSPAPNRPASESAGGSESSVTINARNGNAVLTSDHELYWMRSTKKFTPSGLVLPAGTMLETTGRAEIVGDIVWVEVYPSDMVVSGWVSALAVRRVSESTEPHDPVASGGSSSMPTPSSTPVTTTPNLITTSPTTSPTPSSETLAGEQRRQVVITLSACQQNECVPMRDELVTIVTDQWQMVASGTTDFRGQIALRPSIRSDRSALRAIVPYRMISVPVPPISEWPTSLDIVIDQSP